MIISVIYLAISFLLENIMANLFPSTLSSISYFTTIYMVIAFVIIYPYFNNDKKYYVLLLVFGILFDILYTSTFLINTFVFIIIGLATKLLYNLFPENVFMTNIISYICVILYHLLTFIILVLTRYGDYNLMLLLNIITHSLVMTIVYTSISYFLIRFIYNKFGIDYIK